MMPRRYESAAAFKQAVEQRLRDARPATASMSRVFGSYLSSTDTSRA